MICMGRRIFTLSAVLAFIAAAAYPQVLADYERVITEHTLSNGMHFIILQDRTAPVISFHVQVDTGSADEKYGETGISHLIEHLAFNGTAKIGTTDWKEEKKILAEMDRVYEEILRLQKQKGKKDMEKLEEEFRRLNEKAAGYAQSNEFGKILDVHGSVGPNAYTGNDLTVYWVELPSNKTELWALLESDRLFKPVFRGFYEELEVVKEERRMRVDNSPWGKLTEEFHGIAYRVHPYRNPVIGYPEDLQEMTRPKVKSFYENRYVPSNVIVVIVGDVNPGELIPMLERYFGRIPAGKYIPSFVPSEPPQQGKTEKRVLVRMQSEPIFLTGFHIPDANHPDVPALEACAEILAGGRTSRLYRALVRDNRIALSTGAWCRAPKYPGMFYLWAVTAKGHTNQEMEDAICEEVKKMKEGLITEAEIEGAKARLRMDFLTGLASRRGLASELALYQSITGDWRNMFAYTEKIEKVAAQDIKAVMEKYFIKENRIVGMMERE